MATAGEQLNLGPTVEATINYVVDSGEQVVNIPSTPDGGKSSHIGEYEEKTVSVADARPATADLSLDREGFALVKFETSVSDFYEPDQITDIYNPEIEALIKRETGAKDVVVFDHTLRAGDDQIRKEKMVREPVQRAHNDYTIRSGPIRVQDWVGKDEAEPILKRRFAIINMWRSTHGAIEEMPLLVAAERRAKERIGETYRLAHNPAHRWFYFPLMQMDEAMLIKSYDSEEDGRARFTPHTAFADPTTPPGAAPRQSIETRVFAFF
jgi:hypothetical protein